MSCAGCGVVAPGDGPAPFTWSVAVDDGQTTYHCEACARAALRSIEAKLDREWW